ncbi:MAG: hypothetical protein A3D31_12125 [Candidatus Fluviicola riflensis]|nr:MAG: hypothetical protein CHH17_16560 [Candidatus Fluviicola riflensis]OGS77732.1 MAG: hypothetical protein A3D31_12125 [Candidatus Fluviicola riflensis]OGS84315.1 MAG: hypothetical protein A3E30_13535 [Fluviicola sp. RIFCSPHIGHO2_12_FULL_43_24]OGS84797.1 MAG: hypothetical protein A2724_09060 [Fluviicola sp. RIFCSPHIGHO2_01_FULL_43_53]
MAKKVKSKSGDVFKIPLLNGEVCYGQVLDFMMPNIIRIALFEGTYGANELIDPNQVVRLKAYSRIATDKHFINAGEWPIIGNVEILIPISSFPNEEFRKDDWVGAVHYSATLVESFVNAYYGLKAWDMYYEPNYLDKFLVNPNEKPNNVIYEKL